jgi:Domain of unknown function (DUF3303)
MLYVMTMKWQPGLSREQGDDALARRAQWEVPKGINLLGEYWLASSDIAVLVVFEADSFEPIMEIGVTWVTSSRLTRRQRSRPMRA